MNPFPAQTYFLTTVQQARAGASTFQNKQANKCSINEHGLEKHRTGLSLTLSSHYHLTSLLASLLLHESSQFLGVLLLAALHEPLAWLLRLLLVDVVDEAGRHFFGLLGVHGRRLE